MNTKVVSSFSTQSLSSLSRH